MSFQCNLLLIPSTKEEEKVLDEISNKEDNVILWMGVSAKTGENVNNVIK